MQDTRTFRNSDNAHWNKTKPKLVSNMTKQEGDHQVMLLFLSQLHQHLFLAYGSLMETIEHTIVLLLPIVF